MAPQDRTPPPERFNVARHLLEINRHRSEKVAYIDDRESITYGELERRVRRFAAGLLQLGIRPEERILLVMQDTVDMPVALLGAIYAGIVPVPVNTLLPASDYAYMLRHSGARFAIVSGALLDTMNQALQELAATISTEGGKLASNVRLIVSGSPPSNVDGALPFQRLLESAPQAGPTASPASSASSTAQTSNTLSDAADTHADDIAFWLYSSGSTGRPKGTVHTHANLYWTSELYAKPVLGLREDDIVFSAAKLFFAYGLGNGLTFPLSVGATTILMAERPTPAAVFQRLTQYKPTVFYGVPTLYVAMLASDALPPREATALRVCTSAGEALPREVGEKFSAHFGADILDGIGSTEMLHIFLSNSPGDVRYGTTGKPVPGYELELRHEDGSKAAPGEVGDLFIRGPSAALMYWTNRDKSRVTFQGDWVKSGDKYVVDEQGYYTYAGRSDDMLKVSGQYVSPIEVESALMAHPGVLECAVVGKADQQGLTRTMAYVVLRQGGGNESEMAAALKAFVKTRLAPHKYPREINFVTDLPKTATGKIQRFKLRALED
ncbi:MAG: 4-hydroxybenzoate--CoA ligase [Herminiimonas sp.]|nr:4-hydroxybenzoate--CoA ligase [Herminiimonas sp.]MDB5856128.1 4-hydroxybenzoate--CoA ligase [Herminiimonas sp.]